ncbi:MAG TPA: TauD/TfdA family dioxygenase [Kofleriaceae bacterium]|jgi:alpha-ketoglutarate-dependent taurine dioxygenase|nr:TauD/TfdA family dioxygenase [Kofleriaceae bacterium]
METSFHGTRSDTLFEDGFVLCVEPTGEALARDPVAWVATVLPRLEQMLLRHRAILLRGFSFTQHSFRDFAHTVSPELLNYAGGVAPRAALGNDVYLASIHDPRCVILQHHEMSYARRWPMKVLFLAEVVSPTGGETPVCDPRRAMRRIAPTTIAKFRDLGVSYTRNYVPGRGIPTWREAFLTDDRQVVEAVCREREIEVEWRDGDRLRTRHTAQGTAVHPGTGEEVLFNQCTLLTADTGIPAETTPAVRNLLPMLPPAVLESLRTVPSDERAYNTSFGNGTRIELGILEEVNTAYEDEKRSFTWRPGDVLVIENMLATHGRGTYQGDRRVLAVLAEPSK